VYLGANQIAMSDLGPKVNTLLENKNSKLIFLRADARSKYGVVMDTIDNVRTAGVDQLGVLTEQPNVNAGAAGVQ
jgi:biopolymer transport protein ExbD/biopolymer transport protein TolR